MGEVWEAWDERLERRVAIKRVRPGGGDPRVADPRGSDPNNRERLRREARAAARLSHPAIVQIYDLVETADEDWIVMERAAGSSLAELLQAGPLDLSRVLPLAREIAEGLAEAHSRGLLHRDLKAENVVVTPAGHAKILDFGLAKPYWPPAGGLAPADGLTAEGAIAGTHRAMSPEQANGLDLDPRSDLFSLGTLLYETVTGRSPFAGATAVDTLHRVCTHQQRPAAALSPAVPAELSDLIDQLLEKDRERRPAGAAEVAARLAALAAQDEARRSASSRAYRFGSWRPENDRNGSSDLNDLNEPTAGGSGSSGPWLPSPVSTAFLPVSRRQGRLLVAALLVLVAGGTFAAWIAWRLRGREPLVVAVAEPQLGVGAERPEVSLAASGLHAALLRALVERDGVTALAPGRGEPAGPPAALTRSLAADEVLTSRLDCQGQTCKVALSRLQGTDGRFVWVDSFEVPIDDFPLLATAAEAVLRRAYPNLPLRAGTPELDVKKEDFARYLRLDRAVRDNDGNEGNEGKTSLEPLLAEAQAIRFSSPRFLEAYLLEADLESYRFFDSREAADLDRAFSLLAQARRLAPGDPRPLLSLATIALSGERLTEADEALRALDTQIPGDSRVLVNRALLLERRGRGKEALETMRAAAHRRPSALNLCGLGDLEYRLGEIDAARRTLAGTIERFPRDLRARSRLAQLELQSGSPERAAALYADLVRQAPTFADLSNLGVAHLLLGHHGAAADSFRRAFALAPASPAAALNLADAEWLQGRRPEAEALYHQVLDLAAHDPAPTFWQTLTIRAQALAHLGRAQEAVAAAQQALQTAPGNPQVAYEAALVYALAGDTASARVNADKALAGGYDRRWFGFPWFNGLGLSRGTQAR
jgi:serine/threonine-protein kinase